MAESAFYMEKIDNSDFNDVIFTTKEQHGIIEHFDVSENGQIATRLSREYRVNVYDDTRYSYSILPKISHASMTLEWDNETLFMYISKSDSRYAVKISDYDEYEIYLIPPTAANNDLWDSLPQDVKKADISCKSYYMSEGNLVYKENGSDAEFYIADNSFFDPALLLLPFVLPVCITAFINRKKFGNVDKSN